MGTADFMVSSILFPLADAAAPAAQGSQILVYLLGAGGIGAIITAVIAGLFSKRKLGAEATEIITKAASGVVTSIEAELGRSKEARAADRVEFETELEACRALREKEQRDHESELLEIRRVLQLHVAWDAVAIAAYTELVRRVRELGGEVDDLVNLPSAPPLLPPGMGHRFVEGE